MKQWRNIIKMINKLNYNFIIILIMGVILLISESYNQTLTIIIKIMGILFILISLIILIKQIINIQNNKDGNKEEDIGEFNRDAFE